MIIVDSFGLPGSGKSYITHKIAEELRTRDYRVAEPSWKLDMQYPTFFRKLAKLFYSLLFMLHCPHKMAKLRQIIKAANSENTSYFKMGINLSYTLWIMNSKDNVDFLIMDEGIAQGIISLFSYSENNAMIAQGCELLNLLKENCCFIYINASTEVVMNRLKSRSNGQSRADQMEEAQRESFLNSLAEKCELLADKLDSVVRIHNEIDEVQTKNIDAFVAELLNRKEEDKCLN